MTIQTAIGASGIASSIGPRAFPELLAVGQHNTLAWDRYAAAMRGIFERRYYTNQGPLTREFEQRLQTVLGVKHAVCVTNATIGMMMASEALGIVGRALVPAICNQMVEHALAWCGVEPTACDVEPMTAAVSLESAAQVLEKASDGEPFKAIIGSNLFGQACDSQAVARLGREYGLPVLFDSTHAFGVTVAGARAGRLGALEVFSFGESDIVNAAGGACVATDDDDLAAKLRNIRSSYGAGRQVAVVKTSNGRMSEAQAALGLLSLDDYAANRTRNLRLIDAYRQRLSRMAGLRIVEHDGVEQSNHQALVVEVDERSFGMTRDEFGKRLAADNVEARPVCLAYAARQRATEVPVAARIGSSWCELPIGASVSEAAVETVCDLIAQAHSEVAAS